MCMETQEMPFDKNMKLVREVVKATTLARCRRNIMYYAIYAISTGVQMELIGTDKNGSNRDVFSQ